LVGYVNTRKLVKVVSALFLCNSAPQKGP